MSSVKSTKQSKVSKSLMNVDTTAEKVQAKQAKQAAKPEAEVNNGKNKSDQYSPNKLTQLAGLKFNVNTFKSNMINYFENVHGLKRVSEGEELIDAERMPIFSGAQTAITAVIQKLCELIVQNVFGYTNKEDKSGLRRVYRSTLRYSILLNPGLKSYYESLMQTFDETHMYTSELPVSRKEFDALVCSFNQQLMFRPKAYNFICFLLVKAYQDLITVSHQFMLHAKKRTIDGMTVTFAVRNRFGGYIRDDICTEIARVIKACGNESNEHNEDQEDQEDHEDHQDPENQEGHADIKDKESDKALESTKVNNKDHESAKVNNKDLESDKTKSASVSASTKAPTKSSKKKASKTIDSSSDDELNTKDQEDDIDEIEVVAKSSKKAVVNKKQSKTK